MSFWASLTSAQATVLGAAITGASAIAGIWLGASFFSGKIRGLESAIRASDEAIKAHLNTTAGVVERASQEIEAKIGSLTTQSNDQLEAIAGLTGQVGQIAATQAEEGLDREAEGLDRASEEPAEAPPGGEQTEPTQEPTRNDIRHAWNDIQAAVEAIASQPRIDGRTRAKYARVDRRSYGELVDRLEADRHLSQRGAQAVRDAYAIRNSFRRRLEEPTLSDLDTIKNLRELVLMEVPGEED